MQSPKPDVSIEQQFQSRNASMSLSSMNVFSLSRDARRNAEAQPGSSLTRRDYTPPYPLSMPTKRRDNTLLSTTPL